MNNDLSEFNLIVNGFKYSGWKSLRVTRSMEQLAHSFDVSLTDYWENEKTSEYTLAPIKAGDACNITIDSEDVVTGWIDNESQDYSATERNLSYSGRSKTADLVDCSAVYKTSKWRRQGLLQIAKDLCEEFNIDVFTNVDLGNVFNRFSIEEGETVFSCLNRAARMRGVLLLTDNQGDLYFDRVGSQKVKTKLEYGVNILSGSKNESMNDRFSIYTIKTQASGTDNNYGRSTASIKRQSEDAGVLRYRPINILAGDEDNGTELQKRIDWERNIKAALAKSISYDVLGWSHDGGLWEPNRLVQVIDPILKIKDELLIKTVTQSRDSSGTITTLDLTFPQGFGIEPLPSPKKKKGSVY